MTCDPVPADAAAARSATATPSASRGAASVIGGDAVEGQDERVGLRVEHVLARVFVVLPRDERHAGRPVRSALALEPRADALFAEEPQAVPVRVADDPPVRAGKRELVRREREDAAPLVAVLLRADDPARDAGFVRTVLRDVDAPRRDARSGAFPLPARPPPTDRRRCRRRPVRLVEVRAARRAFELRVERVRRADLPPAVADPRDTVQIFFRDRFRRRTARRENPSVRHALEHAAAASGPHPFAVVEIRQQPKLAQIDLDDGRKVHDVDDDPRGQVARPEAAQLFFVVEEKAAPAVDLGRCHEELHVRSPLRCRPLRCRSRLLPRRGPPGPRRRGARARRCRCRAP